MGYIAVVGAGSWGTTLAALLADKGYDVSLWVFEKDLAAEISRTGVNAVYLPGVSLPSQLKVTADLDAAVKKARYVLNVVPAQFSRRVFAEAAPLLGADAILVNAAKGIEQGSLMTVSQILAGVCERPVAVLSGPSFAHEVIKKQPTAVTLAVRDQKVGLLLQEIFNTSYFRVYTHHDILGAELGGSLKNVIAIAAGICDGLGLGHNARASLITRGLAEIVRLGTAMGADAKTFSGLSGLGDLVLTCTGSLSRNHTVGMNLGKGSKLSDILTATRSVAEGVATALSAYELGQRHAVEMPIVEQVHHVLYREKDPTEAVNTLMNRSLRAEF